MLGCSRERVGGTGQSMSGIQETSQMAKYWIGLALGVVVWGQAARRAPADEPPAARGTTVTLCGPDEPGERLVFSGRILDEQGQPLAQAAVMAYHTDRQGLYNPKN